MSHPRPGTGSDEPDPLRPLGGALLLILLVLGAAVRWIPRERVADLRPRGDAIEYEESARNLVHGRGYWVIVDGARYPPVHPFGFPLLLAPAMWISDQPGAGIYVVLACALATIGTTWTLGRVVGGTAGAASAALLVTLSPLHVRLSQQVMSDVPGAAATTVLAAWVLSRRLRPASWRAWLLFGAALGVGVTIRLANLLVIVPAGVAVLLDGASYRARAAHLVALGAGTVLGLVPMLAYDTVRFGSPLATAGDYWWPGATHATWRAAVGGPGGGGDEPNLLVYGRALAGFGHLYPWPVAALAAAGTVVACRTDRTARRAAVFSLVLIATFFAFHAVLNWQAERFLLPTLPLCAAMAGGTLQEGSVVRRVAASGLVLLVVANAVRAEQPFGPPLKDFREVAGLREIDEQVEPNAVIMAHSTVYFVERFLLRTGTDRRWVPIDLCETLFAIRWGRLRPFGFAAPPRNRIDESLLGAADPARLQEVVRRLVESDRPVYLSTMLPFYAPSLQPLLAALRARFVLEPVVGVHAWPLFRVLPGDGRR